MSENGGYGSPRGDVPRGGPRGGPGGGTARSDASDEAIMLCVQAGELPALQELVGRCEKGLYGFLARYTGDDHLAEDLFQETFLRVVERRGEFDPDRGFRPWLYSIAVNLARDACRRREVRSRAAPPARPEPTRPEVEAERHEEIEIVRHALAEIAEDARSMVLMHFYEGLRYREIAEIHGVPVGTVKSRIHWAVARLSRAHSEALAHSPVGRRGG